MTQTLLRTAGTLGLALTLLTGTDSAAPALDTGDTTDAVGPPSGLPDQVPDFVTTIIEAIQEFLAGGSDASPGPGMSEATGWDVGR
ncbi:hypothetical protein Har1130_13035 [Haloarcula sp. CBA1130]|uniref:hypothetical protein n=1 Tax=unclassified Haloarcula TaxID=2624677 RepID=UPI001244D8FC|nr:MULTISPECIES: hypothetical protein [unclassified Haloarcula]KAA9399124.1 hypothetical protein Har1129_13135 [Haloarcula sp. CBA1129]KAA9403637.1 hypothetical protein Har1130_13035 [Haloarcula sp. CBA1130]